MNQIDILYPVFLQAFLTLTVGGMMAMARARAIASMEGQRNNPSLPLGKVVWPPDAAKRAANFSNQFEMPVLFYAVVAFALITRGADLVMLVLAWVFVVTRIIHAAIHVGPNKVAWRTAAFAAGCITILIMWIKLFIHVVTHGVAV